MTQRLFSFAGGEYGSWRVEESRAVSGAPLAQVNRVDVVADGGPVAASSSWCLRGITSNDRYVTRTEKAALLASQPGLGRPEATRAALIPIRKSDTWWALTQDERRAIFEEQSAHIRIGMKYIPAVARRLHHCRDLGGSEPFDFLTWFEYSSAHAEAFDALLEELRGSAEWRYVDREVDIRLVREAI
jgi:hypothetical protein